jgi:hypothetical protein
MVSTFEVTWGLSLRSHLLPVSKKPFFQHLTNQSRLSSQHLPTQFSTYYRPLETSVIIKELALNKKFPENRTQHVTYSIKTARRNHSIAYL